MIVPSKFTPFNKSILSRLPVVLEALTEETKIFDLFKETESSFEDIGEFVLALDSLFVLGRIELAKEKGAVRPC